MFVALMLACAARVACDLDVAALNQDTGIEVSSSSESFVVAGSVPVVDDFNEAPAERRVVGSALANVDVTGKSKSTTARIREGRFFRDVGLSLVFMRRLFVIADLDKSGTLSKEELNSVCAMYFNISQTESNAVWMFFDRDGSGAVSTVEFVRELRGPMSDFREGLVKQAFEIFDGDIPATNLLADADEFSSKPDMFLNALDGRSGQMVWKDFKDHYEGVSSFIDSDDDFAFIMWQHMSCAKGQAENTSNLRVLVRHSDGSNELVEPQDGMVLPQDAKRGYSETLQRLTKQDIPDIKKVEFYG